jgi:hypothetical protein
MGTLSFIWKYTDEQLLEGASLSPKEMEIVRKVSKESWRYLKRTS